MDLVISVQFKALQLLKLPLDLDKVPMRLSLRRHQDLDLPRLLLIAAVSASILKLRLVRTLNRDLRIVVLLTISRLLLRNNHFAPLLHILYKAAHLLDPLRDSIDL